MKKLPKVPLIKKEEKEMVAIRLPSSTKKRLETLAKETGMSHTAVVIDLIDKAYVIIKK